MISELYKYCLGYSLAAGRRLNQFAFKQGVWPPPTPARFYISEFLKEFRDDVHGDCVEFFPELYRSFFDSSKITSYKVWNVEPGEGVSIVADLQNAKEIPSESFDSIICTHVLCSIERPWLAVAEMKRLLRPGGVILCTNPVVLQNYAPHPKDCWRFTIDSMRVLFEEFDKVELRSYGNAVTAAASSQYLMTHHLPHSAVRRNDPNCPSVVAAAAWKSK